MKARRAVGAASVLSVLLATALALTACSGSMRAMSDEDQCRRDGGVWRGEKCDRPGGGGY